MSEIIGSATIAVGVDSTAAESGFAKIGAAGARTGKSLDNLSGKAGKGFGDIGSAGDASSKKVESATRSMIGSIQRTIATLESGSKSSAKYYETLASQRGVSVDVLKPYLAQLDSVAAKQKLAENALRSTDPVMKEFGVSSAQTTAALRQMPAQLTDIFTSLAGGQNPLLVLIQQGGQIKDAFGGVSNTVKILGNEVASFFSSSAGAAAAAAGVADLGGALANVAQEQQAATAGIEQVGAAATDLAGGANAAAEAVANTRIAVGGLAGVALGPIVAVLAAVVAVAAGVAAYYQGSKEATAYRTALIMTGNAAGTTAGQMTDMARSISKSVGTQGAAAEALAALAATGEVGADNLQRFATVSVQAQKALGISSVDMAKDFSELGKSPLNAIESLNEKYRFLTAATYSQINALQDQGKTTEAAKVAQNAYADAMENRSKSVTDSLGYLERAWASLGSGAKTAWDYMLNIGREDTLDEKLKDAEEALKLARQRRFTFVGAGADGKADLIAAEKRVAFLRDQKDAIASNAQLQAIDRQLQDSFIDWAKEGDKYLTRRQQMEKELEASRNRGLEAGASEEQLGERALNIQKKYTDLYNGGSDTQIEAIRRRGTIEDVVAERSMSTLVSNREAGLATSLSAQIEYSQAVADLDIKAFNRHKAQLLEELSLINSKANSEKEQAALLGQAALIDAQIASRRRAATNEQFVLDVKATRAAASEYADLVEKREADVAAVKAQVIEQTSANTLIGKSVSYVADFNAAQQIEIATRKEVDASILDTILGREREAELLRAQAAEIRNLAAAKREGVEKAGAKKSSDDLTDFLDPSKAKSFGDALKEAFGGAGDAINKMSNSLQDFGRRQAEINKQRGNAANKYLNGLSDEKQYLKDVSRINAEDIKGRLSGYGDMAGAAAGFFGEQSKGYKALMAVSQVFHAAELAMTLAELVPKGISAVLTQGSGDPYTAFGRMAAMAAIVAGLGVAISGGSGGGANIAKDRQAANGTGTVLGDPTAKSESIVKSQSLIADNTFRDLAISSGMLSALRNIESGIGGLGGLLAQTPGVTNEVAGITQSAVADFNAKTLRYFPVTAIIDKLTGGFLTRISNSVTNAIFGGKITTLDTGITAGRASLAQIDRGGLSVGQYTDIKKDGGLFRKDKYRSPVTPLGAEMDDQFTKIVLGLRDTVNAAADALGVGGDAFTAKLNSFVVDIGKISFKGLDAKAQQEALEAAFSKMGDDMAKFGVDGLRQFRDVGEGYLETLVRVANDYATIDAVLGSFNKTFGAVGISSIAAREELLKMSGGLDNFTSQGAFFLENFFTDKEKADTLRKSVNSILTPLNKGKDITSVEEFKKLALAQDLTTEAGQKTYTSMMAVSQAFIELSRYGDEFGVVAKTASEIDSERKDLQQQLNGLTKSETELLAIQRSAIADVNKALFDQIQAAKAVITAKDALAKAYDTESAAAKTALEKSKAWVSTLNGLNASMNLGNQSILTPEQKYAEARAQFEKTLAAANAGDTTAQSGLSAAEQAFLTASQVVNASDAKYAADYARVIAANQDAAKWAAAQVDVQQASLDALKAQVSGLITINDSVLTVAQAIANLHSAMGTATGLGVQFDGSHAGGLANVPFDGYVAELHRGEVVVDAQAASAMRRYFGGAPSQGGGNTDALVAEIKSLREEVKGLRADQDKQTGAAIQATVESNAVAAKTVVEGVDKSARAAARVKQVEYSK